MLALSLPLRKQLFDPLLHLPCGFIRKCHRQDIFWINAVGQHQTGNPVGECSRLARAGSGDHQQRAAKMLNGLALRGVEVIEEISGLRHEYTTAMGSVKSLTRKFKAVFPAFSEMTTGKSRTAMGKVILILLNICLFVIEPEATFGCGFDIELTSRAF